MPLICEGSEAFMLLKNYLFYIPSTLTERWNSRDFDLCPSQVTYDDTHDFVYGVAASHNEIISLADI